LLLHLSLRLSSSLLLPHLVKLVESSMRSADDEPLRRVVSIARVGGECDELAANVMQCADRHRARRYVDGRVIELELLSLARGCSNAVSLSTSVLLLRRVELAPTIVARNLLDSLLLGGLCRRLLCGARLVGERLLLGECLVGSRLLGMMFTS
jgi:hypothetical protein